MLLDEATSALDSHSERQVQLALDAAMSCGQDRTSVIIAHRLSTVLDADQVAVLEGGKIVEIGPPNELRKRDGGVFAHLLQSQALQHTQ